MDIAAVVEELYGLAPEDFTAARNAKAKAARAEGGDGISLSERVARLRRPSVAAWAVNVLVRERPSRLVEVLALGARLREAQEHLDMPVLRTLLHSQRTLLGAAVSDLAHCAAERGRALSPAVQREVEQTLRAAMSDVGAAAAVRSGQLVAGLAATGFEPVDAAAAVADPGTVDWEVAGADGRPDPASTARAAPSQPLARGETRPKHGAETGGSPPQEDPSGAGHGLQLAERRLRKAERVAAASGEAVQRARRKAAELAAARQRLDQELIGLRRQLRELEGQESETERHARAADNARDQAEAADAAAREALEQARTAVAWLTR